MKRRSFISLALAAFLPTNLITTDSVSTSRQTTITAHVEDDFAPYVVHGTIRNNKTGAVTTLHERVTRGNFGKILTYKAEQGVTLDFEVTASRSGSATGYVKLGDHLARINGAQRVMISNFSPS